MSILKLQPDQSIIFHVDRIGEADGEYGKQVKFIGKTDADADAVFHLTPDTADRQLARNGLTLATVVGRTIKFSMTKKGAKKYIDIDIPDGVAQPPLPLPAERSAPTPRTAVAAPATPAPAPEDEDARKKAIWRHVLTPTTVCACDTPLILSSGATSVMFDGKVYNNQPNFCTKCLGRCEAKRVASPHRFSGVPT